jgi:hypothetical protein
MTPKEKAEELVYKYSELGVGHVTSLSLPKQCALIAVYELIQECYYIRERARLEYWKEVTSEIENL